MIVSRFRRAPLGVLVVAFAGPSCDPPPPPITLDRQHYHETCVEVGRRLLGPRLQGVLGPDELAAARPIEGIPPTDAFAVRHDDFRHQCAREGEGDWLLVHRVDLSTVRVEELEEQVRARGP